MLHALGYAQELNRKMGGFSNFAISFTIISILSGTLTLYYFGLNYGGPVMEAWGWPFVSVMVMIVGLGMAEIASTTASARKSSTTKMRSALGRKRDSKTRPRYSCVTPRSRPWPIASTTVTPT